MNGKIIGILAIVAIVAIGGAVFMMSGSSSNDDTSSDTTPETTPVVTPDDSSDISTPSRIEDTTLDTGESEDSPNTSDVEYDFTITLDSGTDNCYTITKNGDEYTVTFSGMTDENGTSYIISGTLPGNIVIDAGDYDFELILNGVTISSAVNVPIMITSGDDATITAKKNTTNYIYDNRAAVSDDDISACVYSKCDLKIKGNGSLIIVSANNNGIHSKDDLSVKNLTLYVTCVDNCLKGNDSVEITSGTITLNATTGDAIKTTSTDLSSKGVQRGNVTINSDDGDTTLTIRAYCDGIDAAFDVLIEETEGNTLVIDIIAGVGATSTTTNSSITNGMMPGGPGWGNHPGGGGMSPGGFSEGNKNKSSYSCKGIKASDAVTILSGTVTIDAYDDAIHANNEDTMESGVKPSGSVTLSGGTITLNSKDDGIHADGNLIISGGTVMVTGSYEAVEGYRITISGGYVSLVSEDDGINSLGGGLVLSGGYLYVYAGGDGLDTNSSSISFAGTNVIIVSTSGGNSAIDADYSYTYTGGIVLAICPTGMTQEITGSNAFKSYGTQKSLGTVSKGTVISATVGGTVVAAVKLPCNVSSACAFYIGSSSATISTGSVSGLDVEGIYFND